MKKAIFVIMLALMTLTSMSFTTPTENKFSKVIQVTYQYGVTVPNPNGGSGYCWGDVTSYWGWTYHGWVLLEQTYSNVSCFTW